MNIAFVQQIGPAHVGEQEIWLVAGAGPSAYNPATGDPVFGPANGEWMGAPSGTAFTPDGLYKVNFIPSIVPSLRPTWTARWSYAGFTGAGGTQVATATTITGAGTGQTNGTYVINGVGGGGTGMQMTVVVSGGLVTSAQITNPGSGYTSAPTFTVAAGGTPGTVTVTMAANTGQEVPVGANLSAEQVQFMAVGGQL